MRAVAAGVVVLTLAGCSAGVTDQAHRPDFTGCDADDFATGHVVFFGLTNNLGPGTVMKRTAGKGVGPEALVGSLVPDQTIAATVVHRGVDWTCALGDSVARAFNANRAVGILPASEGDNAKLGLASEISVTVESVRWDDLLAGPYRTLVEQSSDAGLKTDLLAGRYLVVSRALAARGIRITARFDSATGASAKAALGEGTRTFAQGKVTANVKLSWQGTTKLVMTAPDEVYIAGQFRKFVSGRSPSVAPSAAASMDGMVEATDPEGQMLVRAAL